jgi:hypothetical protein
MRRGLAVVALVALVTSCSSGNDGSSPVATTAASPLAFTAPTVGGGELDLAGYAGRDVALWFWAPY